jgi:hypothetical protein
LDSEIYEDLILIAMRRMSSIDALEMPAAKKLIGTRVDPNLDKKGCCDVVEGKRGRGV